MAMITLTWAVAEALATGAGLYLVAQGYAGLAFGLGATACLAVRGIALVLRYDSTPGPLGCLLRARH